MKDCEIVALFLERNEDAIRESDAKYRSYCFSIASGILPDRGDAEECVADTFLGAWNSIPPHRPAVLSTFLGKITRRCSLNRRRENLAGKRGGGEVTLALDELCDCIPNGGSDVEAEIDNKHLGEVINSFLRMLPTDERRVFILRYWQLLPVREIASRLGFSKSKVEAMLHRSRGKLLKRLGKEEINI